MIILPGKLRMSMAQIRKITAALKKLKTLQIIQELNSVFLLPKLRRLIK